MPCGGHSSSVSTFGSKDTGVLPQLPAACADVRSKRHIGRNERGGLEEKVGEVAGGHRRQQFRSC